MKQSDVNNISHLFESSFNEKVGEIEFLPASGSYREYCRLKNSNRSAIGAYNADVRENIAFLSFSSCFYSNGIPVPKVYAVSESKQCYLIEDLGDTTLFDFLTTIRQKEGFTDAIISAYKKVLRELPKIQIAAGKKIDYSVCYPRPAFDRQSMMWDLNYFKYYFLKLAKIPFDEQALEEDFVEFCNYLLSAESGFFLFRDFQSRNVMLKNGKAYFIDYQGGRKGALQYDLASLLYDGKADIPQKIREELYDFYLEELKKYTDVNTDVFAEFYNGFILIRIMQAMGAYGFRGFYEKKEHFLKSIPFALQNLDIVLGKLNLPIHIPQLVAVLKEVAQSEYLRKIGGSSNELTVSITSFSYKKGIPEDFSGNGGGFVFDCRAIHNPGRYDEFKNLTGKDQEVKAFIEANPEMEEFLAAVKNLISQTIRNYIERGFTNLSVSFGCTGGQHRSVYAAEKLAEFLRKQFPVKVVVFHRELV